MRNESAKQNSADLHEIVTAIKKSGLVGQGKWLSTGVSKPGMTTAYYAYEYPNEMDAYVPFCAPFMLSLNEPESYSYIQTPEALGSNYDKVKAAFRAYVGNKTLQQQVVTLFKQKNSSFQGKSDEEVRLALLTTLFGTHWGKMSYVHYSLWEPLVPKEGDSAEKFLTYILADEYTKYAGELDIDYQRRLDYVDDLEPNTNSKMPKAMSRAADIQNQRMNPFEAHTFIELGSVMTTTTFVDDLLAADEKARICGRVDPSEIGLNYDNGAYIRKVLDGIKQSNCNIMFVYGMQDPWTGNRIPDDKLGKNCQILTIQNGIHNDAIDTWNQSERNQLFQWLGDLGFDLQFSAAVTPKEN